MKQFATFTDTPGGPTIIRPSVLVRLAPLGRLDGAEHVLVGVLADATGGEESIKYGVAAAHELSAVEAKLGTRLDEVFDRGLWLEASVATIPTSLFGSTTRLVGLAPVQQLETVLFNRKDRFRGAFGIEGDGLEKSREEARIAEHTARLERIAASYAAALQLRRRWSIDMMIHRRDWPSWLPAWAQELVCEHSRSWLELPPAPQPPPLPVESAPAKGIFERMRESIALEVNP